MGTAGAGTGQRNSFSGGKALKRKSPHRAGQFGTKKGGYFY